MSLERSCLLRSLGEQRRRIAASIVLRRSTAFPSADRGHTGFLHGLYLSDKVRDRDARRDAVIQFGGRDQATRDLAEIHESIAGAFGASAGSLRLLAGLQARRTRRHS